MMCQMARRIPYIEQFEFKCDLVRQKVEAREERTQYLVRPRDATRPLTGRVIGAGVGRSRTASYKLAPLRRMGLVEQVERDKNYCWLWRITPARRALLGVAEAKGSPSRTR